MISKLYAPFLLTLFCAFACQSLYAQCMTLQTSVSPLSCITTGGPVVTISVTPGNNPPYTYVWTNGSGSGDAGNLTAPITIQNLAVGTYAITVTDGLGCTATTTAVIPAMPIPVTVTAQATPITCATGTGTLSAMVSNGVPPYAYFWTGPTGFAFTTQNPVTPVPGTYCVIVTDAIGCTAFDCVTTEYQAADIHITAVTNSVACHASDTGTIHLTVSGGLAPYTYHWNTGATTPDLNNLPAGNYYVTVTDANGCTNTAIASIEQINSIVLTSTSMPISCLDGVHGSIDLTVSGGAAPYSYAWSNGATTQDLTYAWAGAYWVTVTDVEGCFKTQADTIQEPPALVIQLAVNNETCSGSIDGGIFATASGGTAPYAYAWPSGITLPYFNNLPAGTYCVTVTDAIGCTEIACATITQPSPLAVTTITSASACTPAAAIANVNGGVAPYIYAWSGPNNFTSTVQNINNLSLGTYVLTITDAQGCTAFSSVIIPPVVPLTATPTVTYTNCGSATVQILITGDNQTPYLYQWPFGGPSAGGVFTSSGNYTVTVTDANGCVALANFTVDLVQSGLCGTITGRVLRDTIENCVADNEPGLANWIVQAAGTNTYYGVTDAAGYYRIGVEAGSTYTVSPVVPNGLWLPCPLPPVVNVPQPNDTLVAGDLLVQGDGSCAALTVSIGTAQLRRCFTNSYTVNYCNTGTAAAEDAYVLIQLDAYLQMQSATTPYTNLGNGLLRFNVGDLAIGQCGTFTYYVYLSCTSVLGQTHCTEAHIYPDGNCLPVNPLWSGASLQVHAQCAADSVYFTITNVGAGDLNQTVNYIVIEDQVMLMTAPLSNLLAGDSITVAFPANGSTWHLEVGQPDFHPGASRPAVSVEGCSVTSNFSLGLIPQFPVDDADPWIDIDCTANIGSYDPNDKAGFPTGYGPAHYIRPGTDIEYKIRFQNTGTDTAFTVVVLDTLSAWLDPATVRPGPGSHPYQFDLYGTGILKFRFEHILLPDSNVNEAASHGFIQFRVSPRPGLPLETQIENQAAIYFDFNDPVFTNTTFHRLGDNFITTGLWQPAMPGAEIMVTPNPAVDQVRLEVRGLRNNAPLALQIFDLQGQKMRDMTTNESQFLLTPLNLPAGVYVCRIVQQGKLVGSGKLVVR